MEINGKKEEKEKDINKPTRVERIPLLILAKSPKEVKEILKYFKPTKKATKSKVMNISYAQVSKKTINNTKEVQKSKKPSLP